MASYLQTTHAKQDARFALYLVQQTEDNRKFNRGQLLNAAFKQASADNPIVSVVLHDCDLLPPPGLREWYARTPDRGQPMHLACSATWKKYEKLQSQGYDFFGGVTTFHPADFESCNGFPNDFWGWGMEDDALRLRAAASGATSKGVLRPPSDIGFYTDLDPVVMLEHLAGTPGEEALHILNEHMLDPTRAALKREWKLCNGLCDLQARIISRRIRLLDEKFCYVHLMCELHS